MKNRKLTRITDVPVRCPLCFWVGTVGETEPDCDGDGALGCPVDDCGGFVREISEDDR